MPPQTIERYVKNKPSPAPAVWRYGSTIDSVDPGKILRLEFTEPALVHWSSDGWATTTNSTARDTELGTYICDLATSGLDRQSILRFTVFWIGKDRWEDTDFAVEIGA
jgi:glucoamylase